MGSLWCADLREETRLFIGKVILYGLIAQKGGPENSWLVSAQVSQMMALRERRLMRVRL